MGVVTNLLHDLEGRDHIVTVDNFFTSVPLFTYLLDKGIMATCTLRANRKYVPKHAMKQDIGWIDYRMHQERKVCCVVWCDKQPVRLLSTHAEAIPQEGQKPYVWRKFGGKKTKVKTGPMHLQYTQNMHGVDTPDQLQGVYSCLTRSHKWWHRFFFYMLDTMVTNMWIIHSDVSFRFLEEPMTYMCFQLQLGHQLASKWAGRKLGYSIFAPLHRATHGPKSMGKKRGRCRVCKAHTNQACPGCQGHICDELCYWDIHW
jgi:hypothetical protein